MYYITTDVEVANPGNPVFTCDGHLTRSASAAVSSPSQQNLNMQLCIRAHKPSQPKSLVLRKHGGVCIDVLGQTTILRPLGSSPTAILTLISFNDVIYYCHVRTKFYQLLLFFINKNGLAWPSFSVKKKEAASLQLVAIKKRYHVSCLVYLAQVITVRQLGSFSRPTLLIY